MLSRLTENSAIAARHGVLSCDKITSFKVLTKFTRDVTQIFSDSIAVKANQSSFQMTKLKRNEENFLLKLRTNLLTSDNNNPIESNVSINSNVVNSVENSQFRWYCGKHLDTSKVIIQACTSRLLVFTKHLLKICVSLIISVTE